MPAIQWKELVMIKVSHCARSIVAGYAIAGIFGHMLTKKHGIKRGVTGFAEVLIEAIVGGSMTI